MKQRDWILSAFLMLACGLLGLPLMRAELVRLHADYAPIWTTADAMRSGHFDAFVFGMDYGGMALTLVRGAWVALGVLFSGRGDLAATSMLEAIFNGFWLPSFQALLTVWAARRLRLNETVAWLLGVLVAVGSPQLDLHFNNDAYVATLLYGIWVLGFRARVADPWRELSRTERFGLGVLTGLLAYQSRTTFVASLALWMPPWERVRFALQQALAWETRVQRRLAWLAGVFAVLFVYLETYGSRMGLIGGRELVLFASPNLAIASGLFGLAALFNPIVRARLRELAYEGWTPALGVIVGFAPELIARARNGRWQAVNALTNRSFPDAFEVLGRVPLSIKEIVAAPGSAWAAFSVALFLPGLLMIYRRRREWAWQPVAWLALGAVAAFCRFRTYADAPARYLFPLLPALWLGAGAWLHWMWSRGRWVRALLLAMMAIHSLDVSFYRQTNAEADLQRSELSEKRAVVARFQRTGVRIVGSELYFGGSNELTVLAEGSPVFFALGHVGLNHWEADERWQSESRLGVLAPRTVPPEECARYERDGRAFSLTPLETIGRFHLYEARPLER